MTETLYNIFSSKRGKVSNAKQQLMKKFSVDESPILQYGKDYSGTNQSNYSYNKPTNKNPRSPPALSNRIFRLSSTFTSKQDPRSFSEKTINKTQPPVISKTSINLTPNVAVKPSLSSPVPTIYQSDKTIHLEKSPNLPRKITLIPTQVIPDSYSSHSQSQSNIPKQIPQSSHLHRPRSIKLTEPETAKQIDSKPFVNSSFPSNYSNHSNTILSPQSEPDTSIYSKSNNQTEQSGKISPIHEVIQLKTDIKPVSPPPTIQIKPQRPNLRYIKKMESTPDPSLISVAQRAQSLMNKKPTNTSKSTIPSAAIQDITTVYPKDFVESASGETDENKEPVLSLKERIQNYKASTVTTEHQLQRNQRHKTQPISLDDIVRANAMVLDNTDTSSTIASPSITNSRETLMDIFEEPLSPTGKPFTKPNDLQKSSRVLRAQSCLMNKNPIVNRSFDNEEDLQFLRSGVVKQLVQTGNTTGFVSEEHSSFDDTAISREINKKNPAISRKLAFKKATSEDKKEIPQRHLYARKPHLTQPITLAEIDKTDNNDEIPMSIKERIAHMKENEEKWKSRVDKSGDVKTRPKSIIDITEKLEEKQDKWKERVQEKDVEQYTTAHRINKANRSRTNRYTIHGDEVSINVNLNLVNRFSNININDNVESKSPAQFVLTSNALIKTNNNNEIKKPVSLEFDDSNRVIQLTAETNKVKVPQMSDKSLSKFFTQPDLDDLSPDQPINDDFDEISTNTKPLEPSRILQRPTRAQRTRATNRNHLRNLTDRSDIQQDYYTETRTNVAEVAIKNQQIDQVKKNNTNFAAEALAGLSHKEDFSKVRLRQNTGNNTKGFDCPYKDVMLILVKGRRQVQVRSVRPDKSSLNVGDCFLLVTANRLYVWQGEFANVIEQNKACELAGWIAKTKSMNYRGMDGPRILKSQENNSTSKSWLLEFWKILGGSTVQNVGLCGDEKEDELFEKWIVWTNQVFYVHNNQLLPYTEYWGVAPKYSMLNEELVLIFDFGSELYLWTGSKASKSDKWYGKEFLKQLYYRGYDYSGCFINPLDPLPENVSSSIQMKSSTRPEWVIVGRLPQKGETTLFKEKFSDWPDERRLIKPARYEVTKKSSKCELVPEDIDKLLLELPLSSHLTIDGKNVGRGGEWSVLEDGIKRRFSVQTIKLSMWLIQTNNAVEITDEKDFGQLDSSCAYIIYWEYELSTVGRYKNSKAGTNVSKVYFFWQGDNTSINDKTASALLTIDMDKERSNQIRVLQNEELPVFCQLFDGAMVVYSNNYDNNNSAGGYRLFVLRGELLKEAHFVQVTRSSDSLKSRGIFLLFDKTSCKGFLWIGKASTKQYLESAKYCLSTLEKRRPQEFCAQKSFSIETIEETRESRQFLTALESKKRRAQSCYLGEDQLYLIRGWQASAVTGQFKLNEYRYSLQPDIDEQQNQIVIPSFPLLQSYLYSDNQPALSLVWTPLKLYIWQGWVPSSTQSRRGSVISHGSNKQQLSGTSSNEHSSDEDNSNFSPLDWHLASTRIAVEKIALMRTVKDYIDRHRTHQPILSAVIVYAGLEPIEFQELFADWRVDMFAQESNFAKGLRLYQEDCALQMLDRYLNASFTPDQLRAWPLPDMVVPWIKETYLSDGDFTNLFKMSREEFNELSPWKQRQLKKSVNLY